MEQNPNQPQGDNSKPQSQVVPNAQPKPHVMPPSHMSAIVPPPDPRTLVVPQGQPQPGAIQQVPVPMAIPQQPIPPLPPITYPKLELPPTPDGRPHDVARPDCEGNVALDLDITKSPVPPPPPGTPRILVGIPMLEVKHEFLLSWNTFWREVQITKDYEVGAHFVYRKPVHMAEEEIVVTAQYNKCTHILFMDDDIYDVRKEQLDKLLSADKDLISGVMHASKFPHAMCVFRRYDPQRQVIDMPVDNSMYRLYEVPCLCNTCHIGLSHWDMKHCPACGAPQNNLVQQADLVPFPFTLVKISVFDKIKKPWFACTTKYPTDSWFADRMIEAGMTEHAHMGERLNHNGVTDETKPHYVNMGMQKAQMNQGIVQLTPQDMARHQHMLMEKMKETEDRQRPKPTFYKDGQPVANPQQGRDFTLVTK